MFTSSEEGVEEGVGSRSLTPPAASTRRWGRRPSRLVAAHRGKHWAEGPWGPGTADPRWRSADESKRRQIRHGRDRCSEDQYLLANASVDASDWIVYRVVREAVLGLQEHPEAITAKTIAWMVLGVARSKRGHEKALIRHAVLKLEGEQRKSTTEMRLGGEAPASRESSQRARPPCNHPRKHPTCSARSTSAVAFHRHAPACRHTILCSNHRQWEHLECTYVRALAVQRRRTCKIDLIPSKAIEVFIATRHDQPGDRRQRETRIRFERTLGRPEGIVHVRATPDPRLGRKLYQHQHNKRRKPFYFLKSRMESTRH